MTVCHPDDSVANVSFASIWRFPFTARATFSMSVRDASLMESQAAMASSSPVSPCATSQRRKRASSSKLAPPWRSVAKAQPWYAVGGPERIQSSSASKRAASATYGSFVGRCFTCSRSSSSARAYCVRTSGFSIRSSLAVSKYGGSRSGSEYGGTRRSRPSKSSPDTAYRLCPWKYVIVRASVSIDMTASDVFTCSFL